MDFSTAWRSIFDPHTVHGSIACTFYKVNLITKRIGWLKAKYWKKYIMQISIEKSGVTILINKTDFRTRNISETLHEKALKNDKGTQFFKKNSKQMCNYKQSSNSS